ncbi:hypothetical protein FCI23_17170 [Actinacidiphila oryziradicis]|uniref:Cyclase n=1 Tax=Actinacidiphila oryziradicis TaxID=2571141 RepID=A0A4U0SKW1_9ACTN|nr:hypothetical protein FCI23_17170 [Actinacidiphila oryziradicis]
MLHWGRRPEIEIVESRADGAVSNVSRWRIGAHTGTHIDAPAHFVDGGKTVDQIDLAALNGPARVLDLTHVEEQITAADLDTAGLGDIGDEVRVLLRTTNSATVLRTPWKSAAWVGLAPGLRPPGRAQRGCHHPPALLRGPARHGRRRPAVPAQGGHRPARAGPGAGPVRERLPYPLHTDRQRGRGGPAQ